MTSTASCAPWWMGCPEAKTSMVLSSSARTLLFMSRSLGFTLIEAPASRQTLGKCPFRWHCSCAQRCLPKRSKRASHSHTASVTLIGKRSLPTGCGRPQVPPDILVGASQQNITGSQSRMRPQVSLVGGTRLGENNGLPEEVFRRACCHSLSSMQSVAGGRLPKLSSVHVGRLTKPGGPAKSLHPAIHPNTLCQVDHQMR